jgi:hypothetical protein
MRFATHSFDIAQKEQQGTMATTGIAVQGVGNKVGFTDRAIYNALRFSEHFAGRNPSRMRWLKRLVKTAQSRHHTRLLQHFKDAPAGRIMEIEQRHDIEPADFIDNYLYRAKPIVLRGVARHWVCCRRWSPQYFADTCGDDRVILINDHIATDESVEDEMSLRDIVANLDSPKGGYARFVPILNNHPELYQDFDTQWLAQRIARDGRVKLWNQTGKGKSLRSHLFIGAKTKKTEIHCALTNNFFINVYGKKRWFIVSPAANPLIYSPVNWGPGVFGTEVSPTDPDDGRHPLWRYVDMYEVVLEPGDILFNPPFWWHHVTNMTESVAIGIRWYDLRTAMKASATQNVLSFLATNPTMYEAVKNAVDYGKTHGSKKRHDLRTPQERLALRKYANEL